MLKKILIPILLLSAGCSSKPDCTQIHHDRKSGIEVCMKEDWKIGEEAFANFTILKDSFVVKVIIEPPLFEPPHVPKEVWKKQFNILSSFNTPCEPLGDDKAITVDGAEGWMGTAHIMKTDLHPEFFETFALVVHHDRQYFIDSRCKAPDKEKNMKLVEEICAAITFGRK